MKSYIYYLPAVLVLLIAAGILLTSKAFAYASPSFPSCLNTSGLELVLNFGPNNEGALYKTSDNTFLRCYCEGNSGLQTDLWKIPQLTDEELTYFENDGWNLIPNGSDVGLEEGAYLSKDSTYNCDDCVTPTPLEVTPTETASPSATPTIMPSLTPTPTAGQSGQTTNDTPNQVQGTSSTKNETPSTLASTGTMENIVLSFIAGITSLTGSAFLKKKRS